MNALIDAKQTVSSLEVAEMLETTHKEILRKIDGRIVNGEKKKGYFQILTENHLAPSDFFIPSTYKDTSGKENKCYMVTKKGCEFLAHKSTGEKGVKFTARYINRFWEMEEALKKDEPKFLPMPLEKDPRYMDGKHFIEVVDGKCVFVPIQEPEKPLIPTLREKNWCFEHSKDIQFVMYKMKIGKKQLFHMILTHLGFKYDIPDCRRLYKQHYGKMPRYYMDIVDFFPEMEKDATEYLEQLKQNIAFK